MFDDVDDLIAFVEINQIQGKQDAQRMNSLGRHNPQSFIKLEPYLSDQSFEARKDGIGRGDTQAEKALAGLVVNAICPSVHWFMHLRAYNDHPFVLVLLDAGRESSAQFLSFSDSKVLKPSFRDG